jgi:CspA family cold shock protein
MAQSGTTLGTVIRWDDGRSGAVVESAETPGGCWAPASVVVHSTSGDGKLRAGQVVELDWTDVAAEGLPFSAVRVVPREDLQQTVGG